jgi:hypothetical protein
LKPNCVSGFQEVDRSDKLCKGEANNRAMMWVKLNNRASVTKVEGEGTLQAQMKPLKKPRLIFLKLFCSKNRTDICCLKLGNHLKLDNHLYDLDISWYFVAPAFRAKL